MINYELTDEFQCKFA